MGAVSEDRCEVETPFGPLWLWGRPRRRATLLVLTGLYADFDTMDRLAGLLPDLDVLRAHLPGNHGPRLASPGLETFAGALDLAIAELGAKPLAVLGVSTGALAALALRSPVCAMLLLEPPLRSERLWPLTHPEIVARDPELMFAVFGATANGIEAPRDYIAWLRASRVPIEALIGDKSLDAGGAELPSLVDDDSRRELVAAPNVRCTIVPGAGHNVQNAAPATYSAAVQRLVDRLRAARA